jgi:tetratricopeptide (TPR) repeat protein
LFAALVKLEPENERHWQEHGWWHTRNERPEKGFPDLTRVIELRPERLDYRRDRGDLYAEFGMWKEARGDYDVLFAKDRPNDAWQWYRRAHVMLQQADVKGYRELCREMRKKYGDSKNVEDIALLSHTLAMAPQVPEDQPAVIELAQRRLKITPNTGHYEWSFYVLGLAYYQTGRYKEAADLLQKRVKEDPQFEENVLNYLVLSLCLARLDRNAEARGWLERAREILKARDSKRWRGQRRYAPPGQIWFNWCQMKALEREAEALLSGKKSQEPPLSGRSSEGGSWLFPAGRGSWFPK